MAISESTKKIRSKVRAKFSLEIKPDVRQALLDEVSCYPVDEVAVLLSSGIDSIAVIQACLVAGLNPVAYSFTLEGYESTDFKLARFNAKALGVKFVGIELPTSKEHLERYVKHAIFSYGLTGKSDIECSWPILYSLKRIKQRCILSGIGSDTYFLTSKQGMMHLRDMVGRYRAHSWRQTNKQRALFKKTCALRGQIYGSPYESPRFWAEVYDSTDFDSLHNPEKRLLREAFPELMQKCKVKKHTNLQLGDSGIAKHFEILIKNKSLNPNNGKSVVSVYNFLAKGGTRA
jgi:asparagine synthetase B (glutamine-hydrolysing)